MGNFQKREYEGPAQLHIHRNGSSVCAAVEGVWKRTMQQLLLCFVLCV